MSRRLEHIRTKCVFRHSAFGGLINAFGNAGGYAPCLFCTIDRGLGHATRGRQFGFRSHNPDGFLNEVCNFHGLIDNKKSYVMQDVFLWRRKTALRL